MKVALVIGHRKGSPGAMNATTGITEFVFNNDLAKFIGAATGFCEVVVVYRDTYQKLPGKINELQPDFVISLHLNAYNTRASGTETLYYHNSAKSKRLAEILQKRIVAVLGLPDRGIKPKHSEDRGGYLLRHTNAPCVIIEPIFIDNDTDLTVIKQRMDRLAAEIMEAMKDYIKELKKEA